jgi:hypoxanthine phosphoribosyltransferase
MYMLNKTKVKYTWKDFENDIIRLSRSIRKKDWEIEYVYGPPCGGVIPAVFLAKRLRCEYISSLDVPHAKDSILIIDDISDTGKTLQKIPQIRKYHTVTLFVKPEKTFMPDIHRRVVPQNVWVQFPWELE